MNLMIDQAMSNWADLNTLLSGFTEEELQKMLDDEVGGKKRKMFIERIHQRVSKLRTIREREMLFETAGIK